MTISASIVADSKNWIDHSRLTTFVIRYPRWIHAELMTHRMFSRNASSSRAIPSNKFIAMVLEDPALPVEWGSNNAGMQSKALLDPEQAAQARAVWLKARDQMVIATKALMEIGVHKQLANRLLEPWHHITVLVSGTNKAYANFFGLRAHKDAQPEIRELAKTMLRVYAKNTPRELQPGEWHLPFVRPEEGLGDAVGLKASVARCARTSYLNHDGTTPDLAKDIELHDRLVAGDPKHASPAEHQAQMSTTGLAERRRCGNFSGGWVQYRKTLAGEFIEGIPDYAYEMAGIERGAGE